MPGGRRLEPAPTTRAGAAIERHPCDVWRDLGDLDPVVGVERNLRDSRHIRLALRTAIGPDLPTPRRVGMQRTIRAAWGLLFGFGSVSPFAFISCEGGLLELRGVFGGRLSLSRSAAFSVLSPSTSSSKALTRASSAAIKASFSDGERVERSAGSVIVRLTHKLPHNATQIHTPRTLATTRHVPWRHQPVGHQRG